VAEKKQTLELKILNIIVANLIIKLPKLIIRAKYEHSRMKLTSASVCSLAQKQGSLLCVLHCDKHIYSQLLITVFILLAFYLCLLLIPKNGKCIGKNCGIVW